MFRKTGVAEFPLGYPAGHGGTVVVTFFVAADEETEAALDQLSVSASGSATSLDSGHGNLCLPSHRGGLCSVSDNVSHS